jgi:hypothetical protein
MFGVFCKGDEAFDAERFISTLSTMELAEAAVKEYSVMNPEGEYYVMEMFDELEPDSFCPDHANWPEACPF